MTGLDQAPRGRRSGVGTETLRRLLLQDLEAPLQPIELRVATPERSDAVLDAQLPRFLREIKDQLGADVAFVSQFVGDARVFRCVSADGDDPVIRAGGADPLEASWCKRVVDGRLPEFIADAAALQASGAAPATPFPIGTHLSVPVVRDDGSVFGTLCCFCFSVNPAAGENDLALLRRGAALLAEQIAKNG